MAKKYNVAERVRDWMDKQVILEDIYGLPSRAVVERRRLEDALKRLLREAYNEGRENGF